MANATQNPLISNGKVLPTTEDVSFTAKRHRSKAVQQAFLQSHGLEPHEWPTANSRLADVVIRIRARPTYLTTTRQNRRWKQELAEVKHAMESLKTLPRQGLLREFKQSYEEASNLAAAERDAVTEINQMSRYLYSTNNPVADTEPPQISVDALFSNNVKALSAAAGGEIVARTTSMHAR